MPEAKLRDDLLVGGEAIAEYTGLTRMQIYYAFRRGRLPIRKHGELLISLKSQLDRALGGEAPTTSN